MIAGRQGVNNYKPDIALKLLDRIKQRNNRQKQYRPRRYRNKAYSKNTPTTPLVIERKTENPVGYSKGDNRKKQICGLGNKVCRAVVGGRQIACIKPHHKENQYFRAEGAYAYKESIRQKRFIFVKNAIPS